jgi:hypothetical protein
MSQAQLEAELAALRVAELRLARNPDSRALYLEVQLRRRAVQAAEQQAPQEPLADLIAKLLRGEVDTNMAGQAIARDPSLAGQVATLAIGHHAQVGEFRTGDIAGNIIHITIGGGREQPEQHRTRASDDTQKCRSGDAQCKEGSGRAGAGDRTAHTTHAGIDQ